MYWRYRSMFFERILFHKSMFFLKFYARSMCISTNKSTKTNCWGQDNFLSQDIILAGTQQDRVTYQITDHQLLTTNHLFKYILAIVTFIFVQASDNCTVVFTCSFFGGAPDPSLM